MHLTHRLATAALIGLSGAAVMFAMTGLYPDAALISAAGIGAALAGLPVARLFGHPGQHGLGRALLGALLATALGASVAGFIVGLASNYLALVIIAPAVVAGAVISSPAAAATWLVTLGGTHLAMLGMRQLKGANPACGQLRKSLNKKNETCNLPAVNSVCYSRK